ncbi:MAG: hypothetical protein SFU83_16580 [Meiothermus sp.]|nr:hypothetical protein [Meiothermus sp.]
MTVDKVHSSYILRLTQRLSRLTFELHDVRSGQTHQFDSPKALSSYLELALEAQFRDTTLPSTSNGGS